MASSEPTDAIASSLSGEQIASLLREDGPIVSCVLLQAKPPVSGTTENRPNDDEQQPKALEKNIEPTESKVAVEPEKRRVLTDLIAEIPIDTTPKKSMVAKILGGQFTFLGQYEDEGIVVMVRREQDTAEESDLVKNPHILQPPLHDATVYGDILLMRVADNPEEDHLDSDRIESEHDAITSKDTEQANNKTDNDENRNEEDASTSCSSMKANQDFFLDYTKEEYIKFASRTDILPEESDEDDEITHDEDGVQVDSDEGEEEEEEEVEGVDGEYNIDSDEEEDSEEEEDCQIGMMNLILGQILKRFQEENGRGPSTHELLTMRAALAEKLGIDSLPPIDDENGLQNEGNDGQIKLETSSQESKNNDSNEDKTCPTREKRKKTQESREDEGVKRVKFSNKDQIKIIDGYVSNNESKDDDETSIST